MARKRGDTIPLDGLAEDSKWPGEEKDVKKKSDVPTWLWSYMVKEKGQDEDLVRNIWGLLQKSGFDDPKLTVIRLRGSLFSTMIGIYATAGGEPGPDANYLVDAYQLASVKG